MSLIRPISFGTNPYQPLFEGDKGKRRSHSKGPANNVPNVTANHLKQYQHGDVVQFDSGNYQLVKQGGGKKGPHWVRTHKSPKITPFSKGRR